MDGIMPHTYREPKSLSRILDIGVVMNRDCNTVYHRYERLFVPSESLDTLVGYIDAFLIESLNNLVRVY